MTTIQPELEKTQPTQNPGAPNQPTEKPETQKDMHGATGGDTQVEKNEVQTTQEPDAPKTQTENPEIQKETDGATGGDTRPKRVVKQTEKGEEYQAQLREKKEKGFISAYKKLRDCAEDELYTFIDTIEDEHNKAIYSYENLRGIGDAHAQMTST